VAHDCEDCLEGGELHLILTLVAKIGFTWRLGPNSFYESLMRRQYEGVELSRHPLVFTGGMDFNYRCGGFSITMKTCVKAGCHGLHPGKSIPAGAYPPPSTGTSGEPEEGDGSAGGE